MFDVETGRELWTNAWPARFTEMHSDEGPRTTPEYDAGRLFVLGARGELRCLEATNGQTVWRKDIVKESTGVIPDYGNAATPLVVDDKVIVQNYWPKTNKAVVCYRKTDGELIWHVLFRGIFRAHPGNTPTLVVDESKEFTFPGGSAYGNVVKFESDSEAIYWLEGYDSHGVRIARLAR